MEPLLKKRKVDEEDSFDRLAITDPASYLDITWRVNMNLPDGVCMEEFMKEKVLPVYLQEEQKLIRTELYRLRIESIRKKELCEELWNEIAQYLHSWYKTFDRFLYQDGNDDAGIWARTNKLMYDLIYGDYLVPRALGDMREKTENLFSQFIKARNGEFPDYYIWFEA